MSRGAGASLWHLVTRFFGSLRPGPPPPHDEVWAAEHLVAGERLIWERMSNPDRRHAVGVGRAVVAELGRDATRPVVAAALLHDSGKVVSGLRTPARVAATMLWAVADETKADRWIEVGGRTRRRLGEYRRHPAIGAELLAEAGSDPLTVAWAREHHRPPETWTVPANIATVLKACDDD
jgi:hypothetical protein